MQPPCFCFCLVYMVAWVAFLLFGLVLWLLGLVLRLLGLVLWLLGLVLRLLGCDLPLALHPSRREVLFGWTPFRHFCPYPTSGQARSPIWMDSIQTFLPVPYIRTGKKPYLDGLQANTLPELIHRIFKYFSKDGASLQYRHLSIHPIWKNPLIVGVFPINKHLSIHPIWKSPLMVGVSPLNKLNQP